jgi:poly-gamma-glutamate synthesis protein (capsule biosynthesis protein)
MKRMASKKRRAHRRLRIVVLLAVLAGLIAGVPYIVHKIQRLSSSELSVFEKYSPSAGNESEPYTDILIAAAGDIMFHQTQLDSAYDVNNKTYDFKSVFEDVKPIISAADLAIANFETTTAGPGRPYSGYPLFNSPDEVIDTIKYAGFDVLTTANNHSLDTGSEGLKRTVATIQSKGMDTVGTYEKKPESRVLLKEVKGIKVAILSYTESTNGLGGGYAANELNTMINLMDKAAIVNDLRDAKGLGADLIIAFMHWGDEYAEQPNAKQVEYAQVMAEEGANLILGSHPHVIQRSEFIETEAHSAFVIYSMGNFISNQRKETLDSRNELTEDGIIVTINIRKNNKTNETVIQQIEYIPTWVYRDKEEGQSRYTYRILPVDAFLDSGDLSAVFKQRMQRSRDATAAKMDKALSVKK